MQKESYHQAKNDKGKNQMNLIMPEWLEGIGQVMTYGARKYEPNSWQKVPDAIDRYEAALLRHYTAYKAGEVNDQESGLSHLLHCAVNALFLHSLLSNKREKSRRLLDFYKQNPIAFANYLFDKDSIGHFTCDLLDTPDNYFQKVEASDE